MTCLKSRKRIMIAVIIGVLVIVLGTITVFGINVSKNLKNMGAKTQTSTAKSGNLTSTVSGTGKIEMDEIADVIAPIDVLVETVLVESGDTVTKGQRLATLNTTSIASALLDAKERNTNLKNQLNVSGLSSLKKEKLRGEKADMEELITQLQKLRENPVITATAAGVIQDVNISKNTKTTKGADASSSQTTNSNKGTESSASGVSAVVNAGTSTSAITNMSQQTGDVSSLKLVLKSSDASVTGTAEQSSAVVTTLLEDGTILKEENEPAAITDYSSLKITAPVKGKKPQSTISETASYIGKITWNCKESVFQADTAYTATILLTSKNGYKFDPAVLPTVACADYSCQVIGDQSRNQLKITAVFNKTAEAGTKTNQEKSASKVKPNTFQSSSKVSAKTYSASNTANASGGSTSTVADSASDTYETYEMAAFTIQLQKEVNLSVDIDELDILNVKKGQKATVTLDAIDGQEFTGEITKINVNPVTDSGSTKYTVKISVNKNKDMMNGMSASAEIITGNAKEAILIPVAALQEEGDKKFVYTKEDSDGNLTGKVEVTTGLSDSTNVEIKSGLKKGDKVYYKSSNTESTNAEQEMMPGGMENGPGSKGDGPRGDKK